MAALVNDHSPVSILGAGPAGASAAIAARLAGAEVSLIDKSKFPRHKVCGEFFSPEIEAELSRLGAWEAFLARGPARIRHMKLHFARTSKTSRLPEPAWGLSRYEFDAMLVEQAAAGGVLFEQDAEIARKNTQSWGENRGNLRQIIACGRANYRHRPARRGDRIFGFKAHFEGPVDDAVELFFFDRCYVGVNVVENGLTNVCGLGPESYLGRFGFDFDQVVEQSAALRARLKPLNREMKWISTGPLEYRQTFKTYSNARPTGAYSDRKTRAETLPAVYPAGDALSFVDPFTGSGLLAALKTGTLAGNAAARGASPEEYLRECRASLKRPFEIASLLRKAVASGWADRIAGLVPGSWLFWLTRPIRR